MPSPAQGPSPSLGGWRPHRIRGSGARRSQSPPPACRGPGPALQAGPTGRCSRRARRVSACRGPGHGRGRGAARPAAPPAPQLLLSRGQGPRVGSARGTRVPCHPAATQGPAARGRGEARGRVPPAASPDEMRSRPPEPASRGVCPPGSARFLFVQLASDFLPPPPPPRQRAHGAGLLGVRRAPRGRGPAPRTRSRCPRAPRAGHRGAVHRVPPSPRREPLPAGREGAASCAAGGSGALAFLSHRRAWVTQRRMQTAALFPCQHPRPPERARWPRLGDKRHVPPSPSPATGHGGRVPRPRSERDSAEPGPCHVEADHGGRPGPQGHSGPSGVSGAGILWCQPAPPGSPPVVAQGLNTNAPSLSCLHGPAGPPALPAPIPAPTESPVCAPGTRPASRREAGLGKRDNNLENKSTNQKEQ